MKVAFRLASSGSIFSKAIAWWTQSYYSHVEIVFDDPCGLAFSSREPVGTGFANITDLIDKHKWEVFEIPCKREEEQRLYNYAKGLLGIPYDWQSIKGFLISPETPKDSKRFICSAVCLLVLQQLGHFSHIRPNHCSPELLYELVQDLTDAGSKSINTNPLSSV